MANVSWLMVVLFEERRSAVDVVIDFHGVILRRMRAGEEGSKGANSRKWAQRDAKERKLSFNLL